MATHELRHDAVSNATIEWVWQLPATRKLAGLILLAHGCRQGPRVWFSASERCTECIPRPEERCIAARALAEGYALVAAGNVLGSKGCWETMDVPIVHRVLGQFREEHSALRHAPLFALGPSSGGFFATTYARQHRLKALSIQVSTPTLEEVRQPLPSGEPSFPPLQLILMQRDSGKLKQAEALLAAQPGWAGRERAELLRAAPRKMTPTFLSEAIVGLSPNLSASVRSALVRAGFVDGSTSRVVAHPSRGDWRDAVRNVLEAGGSVRRRREALPQGSLQLAMAAINEHGKPDALGAAETH